MALTARQIETLRAVRDGAVRVSFSARGPYFSGGGLTHARVRDAHDRRWVTWKPEGWAKTWCVLTDEGARLLAWADRRCDWDTGTAMSGPSKCGRPAVAIVQYEHGGGVRPFCKVHTRTCERLGDRVVERAEPADG